MKSNTNNTNRRAHGFQGVLTGVVTAAALVALTSPGAAREHHYSRHHQHHPMQNAEITGSHAEQTVGRSFSGVASWYGNESGNRTASGQRMNPNAMTAAHRTLPFGTRVRVTHGDRSVVVTINDRGPFVRGRVLDLSQGAARAIGIAGIGHVTAEVIS